MMYTMVTEGLLCSERVKNESNETASDWGRYTTVQGLLEGTTLVGRSTVKTQDDSDVARRSSLMTAREGCKNI